MNLAELRKIAVKRQVRIRFSLRNGMECVLNEHGIAQVPALKSVPDFNLDTELTTVERFTVEPTGQKQKSKEKPQEVSREQLSRWATPATGIEDIHEE